MVNTLNKYFLRFPWELSVFFIEKTGKLQLTPLVLWANETEWNHHRGSVSSAIDAFEPSIEGETATVPTETRQSYPPAWQCSATCRKTGQDMLGNAGMEGLTPPVVLSRRCSFRLPFVSIDGIQPGSSQFPFSWNSQNMDRFVIASKCVSFFRDDIP